MLWSTPISCFIPGEILTHRSSPQDIGAHVEEMQAALNWQRSRIVELQDALSECSKEAGEESLNIAMCRTELLQAQANELEELRFQRSSAEAKCQELEVLFPPSELPADTCARDKFIAQCPYPLASCFATQFPNGVSKASQMSFCQVHMFALKEDVRKLRTALGEQHAAHAGDVSWSALALESSEANSKKQISELRLQLASSDKQVASLAAKASELRGLLAATTETNIKLEQGLVAAEAEASEAQRCLERQTSEASKALKLAEQHLKNVKGQLECQVMELRSEIAEMANERHLLQAEKAGLEAKLQAATEEAKSRSEADQVDRRLVEARLEGEKAALKEQLAAMEFRVTTVEFDCRAEMVAMSELLENTQKDKEAIAARVEELEQVSSKKEVALVELHAQVKEDYEAQTWRHLAALQKALGYVNLAAGTKMGKAICRPENTVSSGILSAEDKAPVVECKEMSLLDQAGHANSAARESPTPIRKLHARLAEGMLNTEEAEGLLQAKLKMSWEDVKCVEELTIHVQETVELQSLLIRMLRGEAAQAKHDVGTMTVRHIAEKAALESEKTLEADVASAVAEGQSTGSALKMELADMERKFHASEENMKRLLEVHATLEASLAATELGASDVDYSHKQAISVLEMKLRKAAEKTTRQEAMREDLEQEKITLQDECNALQEALIAARSKGEESVSRLELELAGVRNSYDLSEEENKRLRAVQESMRCSQASREAALAAYKCQADEWHATHQQELAIMELRRNEVEDSLQGLETCRKDLEQTAASLLAQKRGLEADLAAERSKGEEALLQVQLQLDDVAARLQQSDDAVRILNARVSELDHEKAMLEDKKKSLEADLETAKANEEMKLSALQLQLADLQNRLNLSDGEAKRLLEVQQSMATGKELVEKALWEAENRATKAAELHKQEVGALQGQLQQTRAAGKELEARSAALERANTGLQAEIAVLEKHLAEAKASEEVAASVLQIQIVEMESILKRSKEDATRLASAQKSLSSDRAVLEAALLASKHHAAKAELAHKQESADLDIQLRKAGQAVRELEADREALEQAKTNLEEQQTKLEADLSSARRKKQEAVSALQLQLADTQDRLHASEKEAKRILVVQESMIIEKATLEAALLASEHQAAQVAEAHERRVAALQGQLHKALQDVEVLEDKNTILARDLAVATAREGEAVSALQLQVTSMEDSLDVSREEIKGLQSIQESLSNDKASLEAALSMSRQDAIRSNEAHCVELESLKDQLKKAEKAVQDLEKKKSALENQTAALEGDLAAARAEGNEVISALQLQATGIESSLHKSEEETKTILEAQESLGTCRESLEASKAASRQRAAEVEETHQHELAIVELRLQKANECLRELEARREGLAEEKASLEAELSEAKRLARSREAELKQELQRLADQLDAARSERLELEYRSAQQEQRAEASELDNRGLRAALLEVEMARAMEANHRHLAEERLDAVGAAQRRVEERLAAVRAEKAELKKSTEALLRQAEDQSRKITLLQANENLLSHDCRDLQGMLHENLMM